MSNSAEVGWSFLLRIVTATTRSLFSFVVGWGSPLAVTFCLGFVGWGLFRDVSFGCFVFLGGLVSGWNLMGDRL